VSEVSQRELIARLEKRVAEQEARLATYKETLAEIYSLYDTRLEELSLIRRLSDSLRVSLDLKKVCLEVVGLVMEELAPDSCLLFVLDRADRLLLKASAGEGRGPTYWPSHDPIQALAPRPGQGPLGRVFREGRPLLWPELPPGEPAEGLLAGAGSLVCLPLISRQETVGVFGLIGREPGAFGEEQVRLLTIICDQAAAALYNVRLFAEFRRANRALRRSEREARLASASLERLLENAHDLIVTADAAGRIVYVNRRVRELGLEPAQLLGQPLGRLIPGADPARAASEASDIGPVEELPLADSLAQERTALVSFTPLPPGEGAASLLVIARDITGRKQLERQLLHSEKLASVGLLAAGVAHEIGNPLSAIKGYSQILGKEGFDEAARREHLQAIEEEAGRIERIIQELLAYSRPSSGVRIRLDLNQALVSILGLLTNQRLFRGLEVVTELGQPGPEVYMDRDLLAQVVVNLVVNAAQALNGSGRITLTTGSAGERVFLRVADDGPGIPPEIAGRIFDPFFTTKPVGQGTGLGLSICHRIVEGEGGSIRLGQGSGPGTLFEVELPRAPGRVE